MNTATPAPYSFTTPIPSPGPDLDAPAMHQAWENALDAQEAAQRLQATLQKYAAGQEEPADISPSDRQRIGLYMVSIRASLIAAERLITPPTIVVPQLIRRKEAALAE